eukprot:4247556-Pleurochrysis_carterae.AAC.1
MRHDATSASASASANASAGANTRAIANAMVHALLLIDAHALVPLVRAIVRAVAERRRARVPRLARKVCNGGDLEQLLRID